MKFTILNYEMFLQELGKKRRKKIKKKAAGKGGGDQSKSVGPAVITFRRFLFPPSLLRLLIPVLGLVGSAISERKCFKKETAVEFLMRVLQAISEEMNKGRH